MKAEKMANSEAPSARLQADFMSHWLKAQPICSTMETAMRPHSRHLRPLLRRLYAGRARSPANTYGPLRPTIRVIRRNVLWLESGFWKMQRSLLWRNLKFKPTINTSNFKNAVDEAKERLDGAGASGAHYLLNNILRRYVCSGCQEETIKLGQNLCNEFLKNKTR